MQDLHVSEKAAIQLKGEYFIKLGNDLSREEVINSPDLHKKNLIVDVASDIIASWACMGNTMTGSLPTVNNWGVRSLAVGTGDTGWDLQNPPAPGSGQSLLFAELFRKVFANVTYVDPVLLTPISDRSNVVDFTTTFLETEAVGPLVEMGLFGGSYHLNNGTGLDSTAANGGTMINYTTFKVINKPATAQMTVVWRLTF